MRGWTLQDVERIRAKGTAGRLAFGACPKGNKYHAQKCRDMLFPVLRGITFASKIEREVAQILAMRLKAKEIRGLRFHPSFKLGPARIGYKSDFSFMEGRNRICVEVKGVEGPRWRMVQKLWAYYGPCALRVMKRGYGGSVVVVKVIPGCCK
mgnify:CR=1 FL=1